MKFEVDEKLVEPIIREHISTAVVAQLGDPAVLIQRAVDAVLSQKVNRAGVVSNYQSENTYSLIESLAGDAIRSAAKAAVEQIAREAQPAIQAELVRQIKAAPKKTAAAIMAGFMGLAGQPNNYRLNAEFIFKPSE